MTPGVSAGIGPVSRRPPDRPAGSSAASRSSGLISSWSSTSSRIESPSASARFARVAARSYPMTGVNAVTTPTDVSTCACSRSVLAVMSSMQLMRRVRTDRRSHAEFCISTWAITGSKAFSCS